MYPLMLDGCAIRAVVVGGGPVAARRIRGLLAAGATVRVVAGACCAEVDALRGHARLTLEAPRLYAPGDLRDATLVIAATNDRDVNAAVASDAEARGCPVNVVTDPARGTCVIPAVHRADDLVVAVSAGGVPGAAMRIRSAIAERFDARYGAAVARLASLRRALLDDTDSDDGARARWSRAQQALIGEDFCDAVERGQLERRIAEWA